MPYCASTAADSRLLVVPLPNDASGLVNSVPVGHPLRLHVLYRISRTTSDASLSSRNPR